MTKPSHKSNEGLTSVLSKSFDIYVDNFWQIIAIVLPISIPILFLQSLASPIIASGGHGTLIYVFSLLALTFTLSIIGVLAIPIFVEAKVANKKIDFADALLKAVGLWPAAFGTNIILTLFIFGLYLLLIIPGILFSIYWIFTMIAVALRNKKYKEALNYSKLLVRGNWWSTFGTVLVFGIIVGVPISVISFMFSLIGKTFLLTFASGIVTVVIGVFMSVCLTVYFLQIERSRI